MIASTTSRSWDSSGARREPVAGQVHRRVEVGVAEDGVLDVLGHVDQHRAGPAGAGDVEGLLDDPGDVPGRLDEVMVLGDRPADLDHRRLLERVGPDHAGGHLAGDGDDGQAVHLGVGQAGDEVQGPRAGGGHDHARLAGDAGVPLGREDAALLVAGQDGADLVPVPGQRLVHRHAGAAGVGEDDLDAVPVGDSTRASAPVIGFCRVFGSVGVRRWWARVLSPLTVLRSERGMRCAGLPRAVGSGHVSYATAVRGQQSLRGGSDHGTKTTADPRTADLGKRSHPRRRRPGACLGEKTSAHATSHPSPEGTNPRPNVLCSVREPTRRPQWTRMADHEKVMAHGSRRGVSAWPVRGLAGGRGRVPPASP